MHHWAGELRILTVSPSTEGLPNLPFMDHHHPHFIRKYGKPMEDVHTTEGKITSTAEFSTTKATSSKLSTLSITGRITKFGQHLYILQTTHIHSDSTTEERTFLQWHVTFRKMHQEKPLTLLRGCLQLGHRNSQDQRCRRHQEKRPPAHQNTNPTVRHWYMSSLY